MTESADFKDIVKQQADIVRIVGDYVKLRKAGAVNYSGLCPFHNENTPSFSVHATLQFFHCFGCGVSGDVFTFIQKIENVTFPEAVRTLAQKLGIPLPKLSFNSPAEAEEAKLRTVLLEVHERAVSFFQDCLRRPEGAHAREYLTGRGLTQEVIKAFRIGYAPDSGFLLKDRLKGEFDEETLRASGLFSWKEGSLPTASSRKDSRSLDSARDDKDGGILTEKAARDENKPTTDDQRPTTIYSKFRNRIVFPITNETGRVIAFTGRTLSSDQKAGPKYLNSPETAIYSKSRVLFNLNQAKEAIRALNYVILVEGQMDCISLFAAGFHNVIASSGTAFTGAQAALLARFSKQALVNFDPDAAGAKATERTLSLLIEEEFDIRVLTLDAGLDPDLFVRRKGKDAYSAALKNSQKYFDYLIERARQQFPVRSAEGKHKALNYLLPHIQRVPSRIIRDSVAEEIAQKLSIDSQVLRQELKHAAVSRKSATVNAPTEAQVTDAEKILIRALASESQFQSEDYISDRSGADDAFEPARQAKFVLSSERLHVGLGTESLIEMLLNPPPGAGVMDIPLSDGDRQLLAAILLKDDEELTAEKIEGATRALRRVQIRRRLEQIQKQLESFRSTDGRQLKELMDEKLRLKKILMDPNLGAGGNLATPA